MSRREVSTPANFTHEPLLNELGALCGSSYLNEAFQEHLRSRLEGEDYLDRNDIGVTIRGIIDARVVQFENDIKRKVDVTILPPKFQTEYVYIPGLKANTEKRFQRNRVKLEQ